MFGTNRSYRHDDDDRVYVSLQYKPTKGARRKSRASSFTVTGTRDPEKLLQVITALLERSARAGKSIDELHRELCGGGAS